MSAIQPDRELTSAVWPPPRTWSVLIIGCGSLGSAIAAHLLAAGHRVLLLARRPEVAAAVNSRGLHLQEIGAQRRVDATAVTTVAPEEKPFDVVILATQPPDVERAARIAVRHLSPDGRVICLQNGLCEARVGEAIGDPAAVVGAIVTWGASSPAPGVVQRTSAGGFTLGRLDGSLDDPQLHALAALLAPIGSVTLTDNLLGARWSKLAINCAISSLGTIGGERLGPLVRLRHVRRLALEIITEAVTVGRQAGIRVENLSGTLDPSRLVLSGRERLARGSLGLAAKHALVLAAGVRYRHLRSSMLAAVERGQNPPVDFLNGEVVRQADRIGLQTPVNAAVLATVERIGRAELRPDRRNLRRLYDETRLDAHR